MAPKRKVASSTDSDQSEQSDAAARLDASTSKPGKVEAAAPAPRATKKTKQATAPSFPCPPGEPVFPTEQYTNKALPEEYSLPPKVGDVKISAWNITSLKSVCDPKHGSGFMGYMHKEDADILVLTETKRNDMAPLARIDDAIKAKYPYQKWANSSQKGYAGTAVLSKIEPVSKTINLTVNGEVITGRLVCLEFPTLYLVGTYAPNASEKLKNMEGKKAWNVAFEAKLRELDAVKPVIWCGDINVVASARDISDAEKGWNKLPGWTQDELDGYLSQLNPPPESGHKPLVDAWRWKHGPDLVEYSFHSKRVLQREKGKGWRLDTFVLSERLLPRVVACEIRREVFGPSDHVPVVLELSGAL